MQARTPAQRKLSGVHYMELAVFNKIFENAI